MRSGLLLSALAGLAIAVPTPQDFGTDIDLNNVADALAQAVATQALAPPVDILDAAPTYSSAIAGAQAAAAVTPLAAAALVGDILEKRTVTSPTTTATTCKVQPTGYGPAIQNPDSASAFTEAAMLHASATAAAAPAGYTQAFSDLNGSTQQIGYIGLYTLQKYDPTLCAAKCDQVKQCMAFNIYFERDPTRNPDSASCPDPPSTTNIKCTLYGYPIVASTVTNKGQYRNQFQVVIAGSNGYVKTLTPSALTNFTGPVSFGNAAINSPDDSYILYQQFTSPYDPSLCAAGCQATTQYDRTHLAAGSNQYKACNFFNVWVILKNGAPQGQICSYYTRPWGKNEATNYGDPVNRVTITESFGYALAIQDPGYVY